MYDPSEGRWLEEDPTTFAAGDPNWYRFVMNSPTNATDPSGQKFELTVQSVYKAKGGKDGAFVWPVRFTLNQPSGRDGGVIIQKIDITYNIKTSNNSSALPSFLRVLRGSEPLHVPTFAAHYYEAWEVEAKTKTIKPSGKLTTTEKDTLKNRYKVAIPDDDAVADDWWACYGTDFFNEKLVGTSGTLTMKGEAYYVDGLDLATLKNTYNWKPGNAFSKDLRVPSGDLLVSSLINSAMNSRTWYAAGRPKAKPAWQGALCEVAGRKA